MNIVTESSDPVAHSESNSTFCAPSQKLSEHGILRGIDSQCSNLSLTNRAKPVTTSVSTFQPYLLVPPLEGHNILKEFLQKSSQLEVLKEEWSSEFLPNGAPCTPKQHRIFQLATSPIMMSPINYSITQGHIPEQSIAASQEGCGKETGHKDHKNSLRQCKSVVTVHSMQSGCVQDNVDDTASVITDLTDAQIESVDVNLESIESWNELELREAQVCNNHPMVCHTIVIHIDHQASDAAGQLLDSGGDQTVVQGFVTGVARRRTR